MDNLTKLTAAGILISGQIPYLTFAGPEPDIRPDNSVRNLACRIFGTSLTSAQKMWQHLRHTWHSTATTRSAWKSQIAASHCRSPQITANQHNVILKPLQITEIYRVAQKIGTICLILQLITADPHNVLCLHYINLHFITFFVWF